MSAAGARELVVLHSLPLWLPPTSPWLWNQVRFVPPPVLSHVACERVGHLERFPVAPLHRFDREPMWRRTADRVWRKSGLRRQLGFIERAARTVGADVIHSHWGDWGWRDASAAAAVGARHVVSFYGKDVQFLPRQNPRWKARYRALFLDAAAILCEGPHFAMCLEDLGCPTERIRVQHLGVDVGSIPFRARQRRVGDPFRILVAASFREKKGIPDAVEAAGRLARHLGGVELTIVGDASDDPRSLVEKERILAAIARQGESLRVRMPGYTTHEDLLAHAIEHHVLLAPSLHAKDGDTEGGAPIVLLDMAATGLPVVATRHCDIPSAVRDGLSGFLADERDVDGLTAALHRIASEPDLADGMGREGRAHVEREYDVKALGPKLGALYREIAGNP